MTNLHSLSIGAILCAIVLPLTAQGPIIPGDLVVVRIGDGTGALSGVATPTFLDEYNPATGLLVHTYPMPTAVAGANQPLTNSGTATSEGLLTLSTNGQFLVCGGYTGTPGTAGIAATTAALVPRVIGTLHLSGAIDTTTTLGGAFSGGNIRSAASPDGVQFYATGSNGGVQYTVLGPNTPVALNSAAPTNLRVANIFGGQLYVSSASTTFQGVSTVGVGLPTTSGQTPTLLNGFPTATGPSSYDYYFANASTLYVADDRANGSGGIQKWTESGGLWSLQYTLAAGATLGCRGLTGVSCGGSVTLFATLSSGSQIVSVVDAGIGSPFTIVAQATTNTVFRGIRRIEVPPSFTVAGVGSPTIGGVPTIGSIGGDVRLGNLAWGVSSSNWPAFTAGGLILTVGTLSGGFQIPGAQPGALLYVGLPETLLFIAFSDAVGNVSQTVGLPCDPALAGLQAGGQWLVLDLTLPYALQFGTSPGVQLSLGY